MYLFEYRPVLSPNCDQTMFRRMVRDEEEEIAQMVEIQKNKQTLLRMQQANPPPSCAYIRFRVILLTIQNEVQVLQLRKESFIQCQYASLLPQKMVNTVKMDYWQEVKEIWEELIFHGKYADTINNWRFDLAMLTERVIEMRFIYRRRIKTIHYKLENDISHNNWLMFMGMDRKVVLDQLMKKYVDGMKNVLNLMDASIMELGNLLPSLIRSNLRGFDLHEVLLDINENIISMVTESFIFPSIICAVL